MARKIDFENGRPKDADCNICEDCGYPKHPSLECKNCEGDDE